EPHRARIVEPFLTDHRAVPVAGCIRRLLRCRARRHLAAEVDSAWALSPFRAPAMEHVRLAAGICERSLRVPCDAPRPGSLTGNADAAVVSAAARRAHRPARLHPDDRLPGVRP